MIPSSAALARATVIGAYFVTLAAMSLFGIHRCFLIWLYRRHRRERPQAPATFDPLPVLTVQLPLYNELYVARRLIDAVCALDWPRDRLEIQVLDDSTDETSHEVARAVAARRREGFDIVHLQREGRHGYKAGALAAGLGRSRGELLAIFDADFVPPSSFARRLVHHFTDPRIGMVQARWGHLNADHSPLTRVQSMLLDGHFVIEQTARNRSGRLFNFNGTAGIWRRTAIEQAGGWQHDTLTEDLDLSYRAALAGWKFLFLTEEVSPAELPVEMGAFKSQQHRWAKGSIQTARKLLPRILASGLPWRVKLEAVVHLTANVGYVLMLLLALLVVPAVWLRRDADPRLIALVDLPLFALSSLSVVAFYWLAQREALGQRRRILPWVPVLMAVGIGLSVNNARAVLEALHGRVSEFRRTPKYNLARGERLASRRYRSRIRFDTWLELGLALWFAAAAAAAIGAGLWGAVPILLLFVAGYGTTAAVTLYQGVLRSRTVAA